MKYRTTAIQSAKDLGPSGTDVFDIDIKDPISRIDFIWKTTIVTVSVMTDTHLKCISKIELVDGSDVLCSLDAEQLQAINYYDRNENPQDELSLTVGDINTSVFSIDFGRFLYDPDLALDPTKFKNLQLKVTWDEDASNGSVVVNSMEILARTFDEKSVTPRGFLMMKEIKTYTPVANTTEYTDMPTDYTYRKMLLQVNSTDKNPFETVSQFKLSEDNDKKIPIDMSGENLFRMTFDEYDRFSFNVILDAVVTAKTLYVVPSYDVNIHINYDGTAFVTAQSLFAVPTFTNQKIALAASVDIQADTATISGLCPNSMLVMPFGDQKDMGDWYDVAGIGSLKSIIKGAAAVGTSPETVIILQQLRTY